MTPDPYLLGVKDEREGEPFGGEDGGLVGCVSLWGLREEYGGKGGEEGEYVNSDERA